MWCTNNVKLRVNIKKKSRGTFWQQFGQQNQYEDVPIRYAFLPWTCIAFVSSLLYWAWQSSGNQAQLACFKPIKKPLLLVLCNNKLSGATFHDHAFYIKIKTIQAMLFVVNCWENCKQILSLLTAHRATAIELPKNSATNIWY